MNSLVVLSLFLTLFGSNMAVNPLSKPISDFSVSLFHQLAKKSAESGDNLFVSPYSVSTALSILLLGAKGETHYELRNGLHMENVSDRNLTQSYRQLVDNQKNVSVSNYLLVQEDKDTNAVRNSYKSDIESGFGAKVQDVDFRNKGEEIAHTVNEWVKERTHGLIKDILTPPVDPSTRAMILNAIYFNGKWVHPFPTRNTKKQAFFNDGDASHSKDTDFMHRTETKFPYTEMTVAGQETQVIELGYQESEIVMTIVLPKQKEGLKNILKSDSLESDLSDVMEKTKDMQDHKMVDVQLPKFKIESEYNLIPSLKGLGIQKIFSRDADLSGINGQDNLQVSQVKHKAFVRVYEEGTEAAAVTSISIGFTSVHPNEEPIEFKADHPFLFMIRDKANDVPLFMGTVNKL